MRKDSGNSSSYPLQGEMDNTLGVKIDSFEKLFNTKIDSLEKMLIEKEKSLAGRISKIENGEDIRQDRIFQWKTVGVGFVLGIIATVLTQLSIKSL